MEPVVGFTPHPGYVIHLQSHTRYKSPTPVNFCAIAFSDISAPNALGWNAIFHDFVMLAARPYLLKMPTSMFIL